MALLIAERIMLGDIGFDVFLDAAAKQMCIDHVCANGHVVSGKVGTYPSLMNLSADLACTIGLDPAIDLLKRHDVPENSPLWFLNHSNPWQYRKRMSEVQKRELLAKGPDGTVVHRVDVTGKTDRQVDKVWMGMLRNMDTERFFVTDTKGA